MASLTPSSKPQAGGAVVKGAAGAAAQPTGVAKPKKNWILIGGGAAVVAVVVGAVLVWKSMTAAPRLNASTVEITKFAASQRFEGLALVEQRKYMDVLEGRKDDLKAAYQAGQISEAEYRTAKELSWFSDWLGRMEEYYSKSPGQQRLDYLTALAVKQEKGDDEDEKKPDQKGSGGPKLPKVKRDEVSEEMRPKQWTAEEQKRWNDFRGAYAQVKEAREKAAKEKEAARRGTTRPAG